MREHLDQIIGMLGLTVLVIASEIVERRHRRRAIAEAEEDAKRARERALEEKWKP